MAARARTRSAAAVVLVRNEGPALEVLLVDRAPELRFFGGYRALPGGVRDPEDGPDVGGADLVPLARCAVREVFEETGIALDPQLRALPQAERRALRRALLDGPGDVAWPRDAGLGELEFACRILTPPFAPVRYDTAFFVARARDGQEPEILPGELVGGGFERPASILDAWRRGDVRVVPPVLTLLEVLVDGDLASFVRRTAELADGYARGRLHQVRFSPGIVMASLRTDTLPPATTTNCLLVGEERLYAVDPGTPDDDEKERLFALVDELLSDGRELRGVLATHHHRDHTSAVVAMSRRYDVPVRAHELTLSRLEAGFRRGEPIAHGERIDLGRAPDGGADWRLEAVFTPGHDRGHLCFRETRYDAVLVGDMLSTVSTVVIDPPEGHLRTYLASLERLLELPMRTLYPAHGPAVPGGHALVTDYLRHRGEREHALVAALRNGPATPEELVRAVYLEIDASLHPLACRSLIAGLEKLAEDGIARPDDGGRWRAIER